MQQSLPPAGGPGGGTALWQQQQQQPGCSARNVREQMFLQSAFFFKTAFSHFRRVRATDGGKSPTELTLQTISKEKQLQAGVEEGGGGGQCECVWGGVGGGGGRGQSKVTDGRKRRRRIDRLLVSPRPLSDRCRAADASTLLFPLNAGRGCRLGPSPRYPPGPPPSVRQYTRRSDWEHARLAT